jgi:hypothetical protein
MSEKKVSKIEAGEEELRLVDQFLRELEKEDYIELGNQNAEEYIQYRQTILETIHIHKLPLCKESVLSYIMTDSAIADSLA